MIKFILTNAGVCKLYIWSSFSFNFVNSVLIIFCFNKVLIIVNFVQFDNFLLTPFKYLMISGNE